MYVIITMKIGLWAQKFCHLISVLYIQNFYVKWFEKQSLHIIYCLRLRLVSVKTTKLSFNLPYSDDFQEFWPRMNLNKVDKIFGYQRSFFFFILVKSAAESVNFEFLTIWELVRKFPGSVVTIVSIRDPLVLSRDKNSPKIWFAESLMRF